MEPMETAIYISTGLMKIFFVCMWTGITMCVCEERERERERDREGEGERDIDTQRYRECVCVFRVAVSKVLKKD